MSKFKVQIPTDIVRDNKLNAREFVLLGKLIQCFYLSGNQLSFKVNHKVLMSHLCISDNELFKDTLQQLVEINYITSPMIDKLPRKGSMDVEISPSIIPELNKGRMFTQLEKEYLDKTLIKVVGYIGVRLIYLYKSYINEKDYKKQYAHPSEETIAANIGVSKKTVIEYNKKLKKSKLVKIEKFQLENKGGDLDLVAFIKHENHYTIRYDKIDEFIKENIDKMVI